MKKKRGPIILNDDCWIMGHACPPLTIDDLRERMVGTYQGTPAGVLCWCVGNREVYSYETEVGERFGEGCESFEDAAAQRHAANLNSLIQTCGGPLTALVELCHQAGLDLFPSVRMNSHYEIAPAAPGAGRFRRDHPLPEEEHTALAGGRAAVRVCFDPPAHDACKG